MRSGRRNLEVIWDGENFEMPFPIRRNDEENVNDEGLTRTVVPEKHTKKGALRLYVEWKVKIGRGLNNRVNRIYRKEGFATHSELVRHLLRVWLMKIEERDNESKQRWHNAWRQ